MSFENIKAGIALILDEIAKRPQDRHILQEQLREKIAELEAMGHEAPEDYKRLMEELSSSDADELFDNMPL
ncbi:MAG: hypothetical protein HUJ27_09620 [Rhodobacteraceae bacterium]|nr:hypothetical protein [Paracoccaceae bacterium]